MSIELAKSPTLPQSRAAELVARVTTRPFPRPRRIAAVGLWWVRQLPPLVIRAPGLLLAELLPICRGVGRCAVAWAEFVHITEQAERIKEADGKDKHKAGERLIRRRTARSWGSLLAAIAAVIGMWRLYLVSFPTFFVVCTVIVLALDAIGHRRGATPGPRLATPTVLTEGVPLSQITKSIFATFEREGFEEDSVSLASPLVWDPERREYRIRIKTADQIKPEHVRAIERAIGARDFAIRNLATEVASVRELVIGVGDPLAYTPPPEFLESHSCTIAEPLDLGESAGDVPFEVTFAGVHVAAVGATGSGKALALDTPVPTPSGWTTMGALRDGDEVFDETGAVCRVLIAHPVRHGRPCYEIRFSDGETIVADGDHLWQVETASSRQRGTGPKVLSTEEMARTVRIGASQRCNYSVQVADSLQMPDVDLPVGPYTLGVWLGDGSTDSGCVHSPDIEAIEGMRAEGRVVTMCPSTAELTAPNWRVQGLTAQLRSAGLIGFKHIPPMYFRASEAQRRALLAGLLDSDGYCTPLGCIVFAVSNERLARDFRSLVATLGYKSALNSKPARFEGRDYGTSWIVTFTPPDRVFRLPRKAARQVSSVRDTAFRRYITEVTSVESVPVRCITVDSPSSLYLVGDQCIPTHNTKGLIWTIIDRLSACRDCVIWGCDLARGPALPMWRGVIQKRAQTPEEAEQLFIAAIAEIERRMGILTALAEDDDPDNDADEWHSGLGPALKIVIDEFALLADYDGSKGKINLLTLVEQIIRTGRKVWVSLILGTQKTGNSDFGSSVMATQLGIKILLACSERDTVVLFGTEKRDQGWSPHLLAPSVEGDVRDAGKCFVESPAHRTPDLYRTYAPLKPAEVKRRARQRIADGLPTLHGGKPRGVDVVDAVEVPPIVAAVADVFAEEEAERIETRELLRLLAEREMEITDQQLSDAMKIGDERIGTRWREVSGGPQIRGYTREGVQRKLRSLG